MRLSSIALLALIATYLPLADASNVYRWTDEKGVTHYSDTPPNSTGKGYERVNVRTGRATQEAPAEDEDSTDTGSAAPAASAADMTRSQAEAVLRAEHCKTARGNLIVLRSDLEVSVDEDGKPRALTAEEREARILQNERAVATHCDDD